MSAANRARLGLEISGLAASRAEALGIRSLARVAHPYRLGRGRSRRGGLKGAPHATGPYPGGAEGRRPSGHRRGRPRHPRRPRRRGCGPCAAMRSVGQRLRQTGRRGRGPGPQRRRRACCRLHAALAAACRVTELDPGALPTMLPACELVIDAAYGTGFRGEYRAPAVPAGTPVLAIDIPSGLDADTGLACEGAVSATETVTMAALKPGLLMGDGPALAGKSRGGTDRDRRGTGQGVAGRGRRHRGLAPGPRARDQQVALGMCRGRRVPGDDRGRPFLRPVPPSGREPAWCAGVCRARRRTSCRPPKQSRCRCRRTSRTRCWASCAGAGRW